jgi:hypothetical protein
MTSRRAPEDEPRASEGQGVYAVRTARPPRAELIDPRDPAWDELVAAYRRYLLLRAAQPGDEPASSLPGLSEQLSAAAYRYSKGPDFTNDSLGYGEALHEQLWWVVEDGSVVAQTRTSQRTKTGKQLLRAQPARVEQARVQPAVAPSAPASQPARTLPEQASRPRRRAP